MGFSIPAKTAMAPPKFRKEYIGFYLDALKCNALKKNQIKKGLRRNLVFWFKSQNYRDSPEELYYEHCTNTVDFKHEL